MALLPTPPVIVAAPAAVEWPLAAGAPVERRQRVERRKSESADLPTFLNGRDRRRSRDRRAGFGKRLVVRP